MGLHLPDDESKKPNKRVTLERIPLYDLLKLFEHLYNSGADYVDIIGEAKGKTEQDEVTISVPQSYFQETPIEKDNDGDDGDDEENYISDSEQAIWDELNTPPISTPLLKKAKLTQEDIDNLLE